MNDRNENNTTDTIEITDKGSGTDNGLNSGIHSSQYSKETSEKAARLEKKAKHKPLTGFILSLAVGLGLLSAGVIFVNRVFIRADFNDKFVGFYNEEKDYDVLFFGTSHSYETVYPMQLWRDYGITSYNHGNTGTPLIVSYYNFENAIKHKRPKIAVLDVFDVEIHGSMPMNPSSTHHVTDTMPLSMWKLKAADDMYPDDKSTADEIKFPLRVYHSRWTDVTGDMIKNGFGIRKPNQHYTFTKGVDILRGIYKPEYRYTIKEDSFDREHASDRNAEYIEKFIELCKENDIIPLVIGVPYDADWREQRWMNAYLLAAEKKGARTVNLFTKGIVDYDTDFNDWSHMNASGARKVTDYIGRLLTEGYDLKDKRNDPDYQDWNDGYSDYKDEVKKLIKNEGDYLKTLMLSYDKDFKVELEYTAQHDTENYIENADTVERKLLEQLAGGGSLTCIKKQRITSENGSEADIRLTIYDAATGETVATKLFKTNQTETLIK